MKRVGFAAALLLAGVAPGKAQDLEARSRLGGIPLPAAYYWTISQDPDFFELPNGLFRRAAQRRAADPPVQGTARLPIVLSLFADSPEPHIDDEDVRVSLFDGPAEHGTITDYYEAISGGLFRVVGDVLPWVRTSLTRAEAVGDSFGLGGTARMGEYLLEALTLADAQLDFGLYDSDGPDGVPNSGDDDGVVDAMTFEFLEISASCGGNAVWPHRAGIASWTDGEPYETGETTPDGDPIVVNGYIIQSVADCAGEKVQASGTITHEFGHVLGLPDYYHPVTGLGPEHRRWVLGCWGLMSAGSWGCGPVAPRVNFGPTHMVAHNKALLGWLEYDEIGEVRNHEVVLDPVRTSGRALLLPLDDTGEEFLTAEYRDQVGFDAEIPAPGVLIIHRDANGELRPMEGLRYFLRVVEADANDGLVRNSFEGGNRGEAGDVFGTSGSVSRLNAETLPSLRLNATGESTAVAIHSVTLAQDRATLRVSTARTPEVTAPEESFTGRAAQPLDARVAVFGGFMPYTVQTLGEFPEGVVAGADGDHAVIGGSPLVKGTFELPLRLLDARGSALEFTVTLELDEMQVSEPRLLEPLLDSGGEPLTEAEQIYLDRNGNDNGLYDVGDLRAWLIGR